MRVERVKQPFLGLGADDALDRLAVLEQHHGRNAGHAVLLSAHAVLVNVDFGDFQRSAFLSGDFVQNWGDHAAWPAPFRPEIDEHRDIGLKDLGLKGGVLDFNWLGHRVVSFNRSNEFAALRRFVTIGKSCDPGQCVRARGRPSSETPKASVIIPFVMDESANTVGFDGLFLDQTTTGVGMYANNLWRIFRTHTEEAPAVRLLVPETDSFPKSEYDEAVSIPPPFPIRSGKATKLWWEQRGLVRAARRAGVRAIHTPHFSAPLITHVPVIVTIHDVIPYVYPVYRDSASMRMYLRLVSRAAKGAAAILTDSECSRRDIERFLGIDRSRITVVPLAVDEQFQPVRDETADEELRSRLGLPGPVIFNVGGLDARKNVDGLLQAFALSLPDLDPDTKLVIAGQAHSGNRRRYPPLQPVIDELGLGDRVVLPGRISEAEKLRLYNLADLYVFTSLYEGFGLSPLEAMACGTPVICSNRSSLPEVVGDGGILVDPVPSKIAGAVSTVMNDSYLRQRLSRLGLEQARRFSWERSATLTRDVYRQVLDAA
jgi:glycosyltransferase involved in cell wall biosynthesis